MAEGIAGGRNLAGVGGNTDVANCFVSGGECISIFKISVSQGTYGFTAGDQGIRLGWIIAGPGEPCATRTIGILAMLKIAVMGVTFGGGIAGAGGWSVWKRRRNCLRNRGRGFGNRGQKMGGGRSARWERESDQFV